MYNLWITINSYKSMSYLRLINLLFLVSYGRAIILSNKKTRSVCRRLFKKVL